MPIIPIALEPKYDGLRLTSHKQGSRVWIFTEDKKRDRAEFLPDIVKEIKSLPCESTILDWETVIWENGSPIPRREMIKIVVSKTPLVGLEIHCNVFDCLWYNGKSLVDLSWEERQKYLKKVLPKDLKHLKRVIPHIVHNRKEFDAAIAACSSYPGSEGSMIKSTQGIYDLSGRTGEWAKMKNVFELKVSIIGKYLKPSPFPKGEVPSKDLTGEEAVRIFKRLQAKSRTYVLRCAYLDKGKLVPVYADKKTTPGDLELKWDAARKKWKGTDDPKVWQMMREFAQAEHGEYAYGNTYSKALEPAPKLGDICTVRPILVRKFEAEGKAAFSWTFPNLREIDPERDKPDSISDMERIAKESAARHKKKLENLISWKEMMEELHLKK